MSKQSNQKYRKELEKKSQSRSSMESGKPTNSTKQENVSDKVNVSSVSANNANVNHKLK